MSLGIEKQKNQPVIKTLGCRLNLYESSIIASIIKDLNMTDGFVVVNTCTVTNESERKCRQEIRKIKKQHSEKKIIVTGCASELHSELFQSMPEVDFVIGNDMKLIKLAYEKILNHVINKSDDTTHLKKFLLSKNINKLYNSEIKEDIGYLYNFNSKSRAFVAIHNGCNHYCSFCIIPFVRGKFRSVPEDIIIDQIIRFIENGYNEIVLTGVDITDYGNDAESKTSLGKLCKKILAVTNLSRLRLSSIDVAEIDDDIIELISTDTRFMPYFHISIQSGNNDILKKMRRRHKAEEVLSFTKKVLQLRPEAAFGADIIAGFGNETYQQFEDSLNIIKHAPISFVHAFPYSKKVKTLGYAMPDNITKIEKKRRVNLLIDAGKDNLRNLNNSMLNKEYSVICERGYIGKAENFNNIKLNLKDEQKKSYKVGSIIKVTPRVIIDDQLNTDQ